MKYILIVIGIVVVVAVALVVLGLTAPSVPSLSQTSSLNSTSIALSASQAQAILGSSVSSYSVSDAFNPNSTINMSDLISAAPALYGNATSGWVTMATGSNVAANASMYFIAVTTSHAQQISQELGANFTTIPLTTARTVNSGSYSGLNYTYGEYTNSTDDIQVLYGWKGNHAVVATIDSIPPFAANETTLVDTVANATP